MDIFLLIMETVCDLSRGPIAYITKTIQNSPNLQIARLVCTPGISDERYRVEPCRAVLARVSCKPWPWETKRKALWS